MSHVVTMEISIKQHFAFYKNSEEHETAKMLNGGTEKYHTIYDV